MPDVEIAWLIMPVPGLRACGGIFQSASKRKQGISSLETVEESDGTS